MRGLMMGRFQPFHLGHLELVKQILNECDEVIIAITSAQFNYLEKDPFTTGERTEMIHDSLKEHKIDLSRCFVMGVENQFNISTWAAYLRAALPKFDRVYSGNEYVSMLLEDSQIKVVKPKFFNVGDYNATRIRSMIISGQDWHRYVPKSVTDIIQRINGENRLKVISKSDTKPTEH